MSLAIMLSITSSVSCWSLPVEIIIDKRIMAPSYSMPSAERRDSIFCFLGWNRSII